MIFGLSLLRHYQGKHKEQRITSSALVTALVSALRSLRSVALSSARVPPFYHFTFHQVVGFSLLISNPQFVQVVDFSMLKWLVFHLTKTVPKQ